MTVANTDSASGGVAYRTGWLRSGIPTERKAREHLSRACGDERRRRITAGIMILVMRRRINGYHDTRTTVINILRASKFCRLGARQNLIGEHFLGKETRELV